MTEGFLLREVFNHSLVEELASNIEIVWSGFDKRQFVEDITPHLSALSFNARLSLIADRLRSHLPDDFSEAAKILINALGAEPETEQLTGFDGFIILPQTLFISRYGLEEFDSSITALYEMTKRFSAEMDIRPFLMKYPEKTLAFLHKITSDKSPFARRLASEGTRPRLPLAPRLPQFQKEPAPVIELLEKLKEDQNLMVRRSVANNMNDIAKDNPDIVISVLERWQNIDNEGTQWLISHALRSLLKQGHPGALKLMGYDPQVNVSVSGLKINPTEITVGDELSFEFTVTSNEHSPCNLMIDYVIYFLKANGKQKPKIFKATKKQLSPGEKIIIKKKRSFKKIGIRTYYNGQHSFEIQINGQRYNKVDFRVTTIGLTQFGLKGKDSDLAGLYPLTVFMPVCQV